VGQHKGVQICQSIKAAQGGDIIICHTTRTMLKYKVKQHVAPVPHPMTFEQVDGKTVHTTNIHMVAKLCVFFFPTPISTSDVKLRKCRLALWRKNSALDMIMDVDSILSTSCVQGSRHA
jgi:hypothetical protein